MQRWLMQRWLWVVLTEHWLWVALGGATNRSAPPEEQMQLLSVVDSIVQKMIFMDMCRRSGVRLLTSAQTRAVFWGADVRVSSSLVGR